jgi:ABC-type glycerol-3-phosphate transport system substrate-binding protein
MKHTGHLLKFAAVAAIVSATLGPSLAPRHSQAAAGWQGTITMWAQSYTPSNKPAVAGAPPPHHAFFTLAAQWEKLHPGVTIQFVTIPAASGAANQYTILRTLMAGNSAPDIFFFQPSQSVGEQDSWLASKLIIPLTSYLDKPDPYAPSFKTWGSIFLPPWSSYARATNGDYATVPVNTVAAGIYYNVTMMAKLGIHMPPATWAEFAADCAKIKAAGYGAFGTPNWAVPFWETNAFGPVFLQNDIKKFATLTYNQATYSPNGVNPEEWSRAFLKLGYKFSTDPGIVAMTAFLHNFVQTSFTTGWAGTSADTSFVQGREAFFFDGTWENPTLIADKLPFKYATFWFPPITKVTSPLAATGAAATPAGVGGFGGVSYAVNGNDATSAKLPLIIDWLQYITAPKQDGVLVNDEPDFLPADHGVSGNASIANMFAPVASSLANSQGNPPIDMFDWFTPADTTAMARIFNLYLLGSMSQSSFLSQADALALHSAKALVAANDKTKNKNGTWDLSKW